VQTGPARACAVDAAVLKRLEALLQQQAGLPRPPEAGR